MEEDASRVAVARTLIGERQLGWQGTATARDRHLKDSNDRQAAASAFGPKKPQYHPQPHSNHIQETSFKHMLSVEREVTE